MKRGIAFMAAVMLTLTSGAALTAGGQKGGSGGGTSKTVTTEYPVQVQFRDLSTDAIVSDGKSPSAYVNGKDGVRAVMEVVTTTTNGVTTYNSGKLVFQISGYKGRIVRKINVNYTNPVDAGCASSLPSVASGTLNPYLIQMLGRVALLPIGTDFAATNGYFGSTPTDASSVFRFSSDALPNYPGNCSTLIVAQRTSPTTWIFTTDVDPDVLSPIGPGYRFFRGYQTWDYYSNVGDTAQFGNSGSGVVPFYGNYKMPFSMTVTCLSAAACPPVNK